MRIHVRALVLSLAMAHVAAAAAAAQTRDPAGSLGDSWITTKIAASYFIDADVKGRTIDVQTVNGIVTLTGTVRSDRERDQAVSIARTVDGVKQVVDRLTIAPDAPVGTSGASPTGSASEKINDAWISTKVQARYFLDAMIKARNIGVSTRDGVVTLSGTVTSEGERQRAISVARGTDGVTQVNDRLRVEPGGAGRDSTGASTPQGVPGSDELSRLMESDAVILAQIKSRFALDTQVSALAIDVDVDHGVVTLKGEVRDQAARDRALAIAREVKGISSVKDELRLGR